MNTAFTKYLVNQWNKWSSKRWPWVLLMTMSISGAIIFGYLILSHSLDYITSGITYNNIRSQVRISGSSSAQGEYRPPVDFDKLAQLNPDTVGWLIIKDTPIDYPIVQGADNDFYLHNDFHRASSFSGCLFIDSRNARDFSDINTIIYGHNMRNGSMFGALKNFREGAYLSAHSDITLYGVREGFDLTPFAVYTAGDIGDYMKHEFTSEPEFIEWIDAALAKTDVELTYRPQSDERVITLVSCVPGSSTSRVVMHLAMRPIAN